MKWLKLALAVTMAFCGAMCLAGCRYSKSNWSASSSPTTAQVTARLHGSMDANQFPTGSQTRLPFDHPENSQATHSAPEFVPPPEIPPLPQLPPLPKLPSLDEDGRPELPDAAKLPTVPPLPLLPEDAISPGDGSTNAGSENAQNRPSANSRGN